MKRPLLFLPLLVCAAISCSSPSGPKTSSTMAASIRWKAFRPASYALTQDVLCFCYGLDSAARVTVSGNTITSVSNAVTGTPVPVERWGSYKTVDDLFALIETYGNDPDSRVEADYDPVYGYPTLVAVDYYLSAVDDEVTYRSRNLLPLPAAAQP